MHFEIGPPRALPHHRVGIVIGLVEQHVERDLEPAFDLARIGDQRQVGRDHAQNRRDLESGPGHVFVARSDHADLGGVHRQLLMRLAQGGLHRRFARVDLAAGKGDLAGMATQRLRAAGEDDAGPLSLGDGDQHGGRSRVVVDEGLVGQQAFHRLAMPVVEDALQPVEQVAHAGLREKVSPSLATVQSSPRDRAISASCS